MFIQTMQLKIVDSEKQVVYSRDIQQLTTITMTNNTSTTIREIWLASKAAKLATALAEGAKQQQWTLQNEPQCFDFASSLTDEEFKKACAGIYTDLQVEVDDGHWFDNYVALSLEEVKNDPEHDLHAIALQSSDEDDFANRVSRAVSEAKIEADACTDILQDLFFSPFADNANDKIAIYASDAFDSLWEAKNAEEQLRMIVSNTQVVSDRLNNTIAQLNSAKNALYKQKEEFLKNFSPCEIHEIKGEKYCFYKIEEFAFHSPLTADFSQLETKALEDFIELHYENADKEELLSILRKITNLPLVISEVENLLNKKEERTDFFEEKKRIRQEKSMDYNNNNSHSLDEYEPQEEEYDN